MSMIEMDGTSEMDSTEIANLLIQQRDLYRALGRLSERQRNLITSDEPERLLSLLAERQKLIEQMQTINQRLQPFQVNWRQIRTSLDEKNVRRIDDLVNEINGLLGDILKTDEADTALLSVRKSERGQAIGAMQSGRQADRAYSVAGESYPSGSGMDWTQE